MNFENLIISSIFNQLIHHDLSNLKLFMQQNVNISNSDLRYSIGLVIICLLVLILLWLPDLLKGKN
ncbi:conserved hypothetical protein [Hyella patelloides LEGE 07179]|uniref:Uncharacterized protein n=1 Tax=Hyella patelloides LEGE 07179 TaxID=945734 RepID=A0A563W4F2_9CYAN|nr:hypothetical protein [Hyella patelloides]VEP18571.1 conserved hypothetical protein [Hyella patelloides LEGE 07179]